MCDRLAGSRVMVLNAEVRAPLLGLFRGEIDYGYYVPLEIAAFFDAGVAWSHDSRPAFFGGARGLVRSYGAAVRAGRPIKWQIGIGQGF